MRKDLNKVLCERERHRSKMKFHEVRGEKPVTGKKRLGAEAWPFPGESTSPYPVKESMKKPHIGGWTKDLNENLNALWGFLRKSVGKNWDKVYSEVCKTFDKRKVVNQHIIQHLFENVEINTKLVGSKVVFLNTGGRAVYNKVAHYNEWIDIKEAHADFYVHPISKILLSNKEKKTYGQVERERKEAVTEDVAKNLLLLSKFNNQNGNGARYAIKIESIWYEISVIKKPDPVKRRKVNAKGELEYFTEYPSFSDISIYGAKYKPKELDGPFYVSRKNQLSSNNLKKLNLQNG